MYQLHLQNSFSNWNVPTCRERLERLLAEDLDFHTQASGYASHNFHSFPAKFPPQLPRKFILELTSEGDTILDPMAGSGTTVVEALLANRRAIGFDIDPLALLISKVKTMSLDKQEVEQVANLIVEKAQSSLAKQSDQLQHIIKTRWNRRDRTFLDYWFAPATQIELMALVLQIERIPDVQMRAFFELAFSAIIITKSGGVSLAFDLAHTRPHKAKVVIDRDGEIIVGADLVENPSRRVQLLTKTLRSPLEEFRKRVDINLAGIMQRTVANLAVQLSFADAQRLPLDDCSIDLIVTSPPYASNAIDYMRAHKFSLVWMGYTIDSLGERRNNYIGGESISGMKFEDLPPYTRQVVADIAKRDQTKGLVLHRYYSEMTRVLREMYRVLRSGKAAIVVVGNSIMRGRDTETDRCLAEIGQIVGFEPPIIGIRTLDRNRRMLPQGIRVDRNSQIQQRMHQESVIGFSKP